MNFWTRQGFQVFPQPTVSQKNIVKGQFLLNEAIDFGHFKNPVLQENMEKILKKTKDTSFNFA